MRSSSRLSQPLFQPAARKKIEEINVLVNVLRQSVAAIPLLYAQSIIRTRLGRPRWGANQESRCALEWNA